MKSYVVLVSKRYSFLKIFLAISNTPYAIKNAENTSIE